MRTLAQVADELANRLKRIFSRGPEGWRPVYGVDTGWSDAIQFYEYFHGDTGRGLGASHQTGWTSLIAALLERS